MARTFDQVLADITARSDPQRQIVLNQISQLPTQQTADEASLGAKKDQAFTDITDSARRRGLGFSGIPLGEQAKYTATDYAPALANLKTSYGNRQASLESALADIGKTNYNDAYGIFNQDRNFEEQQRQFNANLALQKQQAAAASASNASLASLFGGGGAAAPAAAKIQQRADKGFNFQDGSGNAISAAQYAQLKGIPFRDLLSQMAKAGDAGAKQALGYVGNDFGYNAPKVGSNTQVASLLNSLLWGVNTAKARTPINLTGSLGGSTQRIQG
jgi:hypothetical protein